MSHYNEAMTLLRQIGVIPIDLAEHAADDRWKALDPKVRAVEEALERSYQDGVYAGIGEAKAQRR